MQSRTYANFQRQRGYTLMEILVAVAIFATVMIVALLLYDQSNRVFKQSNEAAEMQQNTRVAYEKVVADLRMAGFDYKRAGTPTAGIPTPWAANREYSIGSMVTPTVPNGHVYRCITAGTSGNNEPAWPTAKGATVADKAPLVWQESGVPVYEQPDEQIEYAHTAAITVRGNFDYDDPSTTDQGREPDLEQSSAFRFPVVTTGNDEIVTYALVSRSGNANANQDTISFFADVNAEGTAPSRTAYPGGTAEREIKITGVDLTNQYPPYTLMRYTLSNDGKVVATALADNIRSMTFQYWQNAQANEILTDLDGNTVNNVGGGGKYDPSKPNDVIAERLIRGRIRAVTATITGMNPQPDYNYKHPTDTVAANYRQYELRSTIVGRNLGVKGVPQSDTSPPGPPVISALCSGYCGVAVLTWEPAPGTVDTNYTVLYDTTPGGSFSNVLPAGTQTTYAVDLTQLDLTKTYYFKVAATNEAGTTMSTNTVAVNPKNATKPSAPQIVSTTGVQNNPGAGYPDDDNTARPNEIEILWKAPTTNAAGTPSCSPSGSPPTTTAAAEIKGYRVWRSLTSGFTPGDAGSTMIVDVETPGPTTDGSGTWRFIDRNVANCERYYYRVQAVEWCAANSAYNVDNDTNTALSAFSAEMPGRARSLTKAKMPANLKVAPESACNADTNQCYPVVLTWDKVTQNINNEPIIVQRYVLYRQQKKMGSDVGTPVLAGSISDGTTKFSEPAPLLEHDPSNPALKYTYEYTVAATYCGVDGVAATVSFPGSCSTGASVVPGGAEVSGSGTGDDPYVNVESLTVLPYATNPILGVQVKVDNGAFTTLAAPYSFPWDDDGDGQLHTVTFRVATNGCTEDLVVIVRNDPPPCAFEISVGNTPGVATQLEVFIKNISDQKVAIDRFDITWAGQTGFSWTNIQTPSNATFTATGTASEPRTVQFTPTAAADKNIDPGQSLRIRMNFTGTGFAYGGSVTAVRVLYKQTAVSNDQLDCTGPIVRCELSASVSLDTATTIRVAIKNNSAEELTVSRISITWAGQNKWTWQSGTFGAQTIPVTTAQNGGTETFTPTGLTVPANSTLNAILTFNPSGPGAVQALDPNGIGTVLMEYRTPTSDVVTLKCRAR